MRYAGEDRSAISFAADNLRFHPLAIAGMDPAEPFVQVRVDFGIGIAQHFFPARGKINLVGPRLPVPQAVVGSLRRQRVALLAFPQGFFL